MGSYVDYLIEQLTVWHHHRVSTRFTPGLNVTLPDLPVDYTLEIVNEGTRTTSYSTQVVSPLLPSQAPFEITLEPKQVFTLPITLNPSTLGFYTLTASVEAVGPEMTIPIRREASAGLRVVHAFVEVARVTANPAFVETGVSSTTLAVGIANIANVYRPATAHAEILASDGTVSWSEDFSLGILTGDLYDYPLGVVSTSGWESGIYTITVDLLNAEGALIPDGTGHGYLAVGEAVQLFHAIQPPVVGPGTVTAKTVITTQINPNIQNPSPITLSLPITPTHIWSDSDPGGGYKGWGILATAAVGDINDDAIPEIAITSADAHLVVYRGDGQDAGNGSPLLWSAYVGGKPCEPAIAELDGMPGAEIVVGSDAGFKGFHHDGTLFFNSTVKANWSAGGPAIANLNDDPAPEIVLAGNNGLYLFDANGNTLASYSFSSPPMVPTLADLTGDGYLDILTSHGGTLYLFEYINNQLSLKSSYALASGQTSSLMSAAVADVDGQLPNGDPGPEIAIASGSYIQLLDVADDGTISTSNTSWTKYIQGGRQPGPVSIADTDGDGEVELITSMKVNGGRIYVLNADGSELWLASATDSTSGTGTSVHDFDGDGKWEVLWNGYNQGFTIFDGSTGAWLFNSLMTLRSIHSPIVNTLSWLMWIMMVMPKSSLVTVKASMCLRMMGAGLLLARSGINTPIMSQTLPMT